MRLLIYILLSLNIYAHTDVTANQKINDLIGTILFLLLFIQIYAKGFVQWRPLMTVCKVKTIFSLIGNFHRCIH